MLAFQVEEKETRARELIRMMSVQNRAIVVSWYMTYGLVLLILNTLVVAISGVPYGLGLFTVSAVLHVAHMGCRPTGWP